MITRLRTILSSFRTRITLILVLSMLFSGAVSNYLVYEYFVRSQFEQLRGKLIMVAQSIALQIDSDAVMGIPLDSSGVNTAQYRAIREKLLRVKRIAPSISYIYIMKNTDRKGIFKFVLDLTASAKETKKANALPGDDYNASAFPEMLKAFDGPSADKELTTDEWGVFLSGYAPIRDKNDRAVALLGVDMSAEDVRNIHNEVNKRALYVLIMSIVLSVAIGFFISGRVSKPIKKLVVGTSQIAKGNFQYEVDSRGRDEFAELARSFNRMSSDLREHVEELKVTTAEKERLLKELEIAKGIQQSFLPQSLPAIKGFEVAAISVPARVVGGDFYDFIPVGEGRWALVIADVSGKGIPAALFMALSRTLIHATASENITVPDALKKTNRLILENSRASMFVTLFYAILDSGSMVLQYANAGHNPPILVNENTSDVILLKAQGMPLGMTANLEMTSKEVGMKEGDILVLYTDGVTEAVNDRDERFEEERLARVVRETSRLPAQSIIEKIQDELRSFVGGQPQFDDITLMIIKAVGNRL